MTLITQKTTTARKTWFYVYFLMNVIPGVCVGAVFLVLQGVQVGLSAVTVVQQTGTQLQNRCIRLVGECVSV